MATDRPDGAGEDTGWFFEPQSDEQAELSYRGEAPRPGSTPVSPASNGASAPATPTAPSTPVEPAATPGPPSGHPGLDDTGQATAPFVPPWAGAAQPAPPAASAAARPVADSGAHSGAGTMAPGPGSPGSPNRPAGRPPSGAGRAIALGAMIGTVVLLLGWYFLVRDPGTDPTRATPVRTSAASLSPSATPTPKRPRSTAVSTRTTARPSPRTTGAAPSASATPSPTSALNDASNRLAWTYIIDGLGPVKLGLSAAKATALGVLQDVPSACDAHSPTDLLGATRVYSTGGKVTAIDIRSTAFPSGLGIRVGATLDNLKTLYGDALKYIAMSDGDTGVKQWALTSNTQYVAYIVDDAGTVTRIAIGYRDPGGSIMLPPPC